MRQTSGRLKNSCGSVGGRRLLTGCDGGGYLLMGLGKSQIATVPVFLQCRTCTCTVYMYSCLGESGGVAVLESSKNCSKNDVGCCLLHLFSASRSPSLALLIGSLLSLSARSLALLRAVALFSVFSFVWVHRHRPSFISSHFTYVF